MTVSVAFIASLNICIGTGLIGSWGEWYSPSAPYRRQTDALLSVKFALSDSPKTIENEAWGCGGVQQIWGLAVPFCRLPFEAIARLAGQPAFPDRLVLAFAIATSIHIVFRAFEVSERAKDTNQRYRALLETPGRVVAILLLIAFPPIISMCRGPFNVYEEAILYEYYFSIAIFAGTMRFAERPSLTAYIMISVFGGLSGFIRPIAILYGAASTLIIVSYAWYIGWSWRKVMLGPILFIFGVASLYYSNRLRFGSGLEFGHQLMFANTEMMYVLRFGSPFASESLWSAGRELVGSMFFVKDLNGLDCYRENVVTWQSSTPRWRKFYGTTFDATYLFFVAANWIAVIAEMREIKRVCGRRPSLEIVLPAIWSSIGLMSVFAILAFYCCMSSRYILDFAPAISVMVAAVILLLDKIMSGLPIMVRWAGQLIVLFWWALEIGLAANYFGPTPVLTQEEIIDSTDQQATAVTAFPDEYDASSDPAEVTGIAFNGAGWKHPSGETGSIVVLFVDNPQLLVVDLEQRSESDGEEEVSYDIIRAKVGLEVLRLKATKRTQSGIQLVFEGPDQAFYRDGIQTLSLRMAPAADFLHDPSQFRLLRVRWR